MPIAIKDRVRRAWKTWALEIVVVLLIFAVVRAWHTRDVASGPAPVVSGTLVDGREFALDALKGQPALVHFWATWCGVCRAEQGNVDAVVRSGAPAVTIASSSGDAEQVRAYLRDNGLDWPVLIDEDGDVARAFGVNAFPTSFVVDADGDIRFAEVGYTTTFGFRARMWLAGL